jgi:N-acetylglucosamine-6-phosphate deacetylase
MLAIVGGRIVLPGGEVTPATLLVNGAQIATIDRTCAIPAAGEARLDASGAVVVPGFIDVHVHGVDGHDVHDEGDAVARIAARLPRFGVTGFCPTTVACGPDSLRRVLAQVRACMRAAPAGGARVLGAHLESNFINPDMRGAQPLAHLRLPESGVADAEGESYSGADILSVVAEYRDAIAIVTIAPELPGALDAIRTLVTAGHLVSLGHSAADFVVANAAFDAGATQVTHLFNRMPPFTHREPGLAGAALARTDVLAELICDGYHVHPAVARVAIAAKGPSRILAITDGTGASGLAAGGCATLGGRPIRAGEQVALLDEGTVAGSTLTMDGAFRMLTDAGSSLGDAAVMCATTPASALRLEPHGVIAPGAVADLVVLDEARTVRHTVIAGQVAYTR